MTDIPLLALFTILMFVLVACIVHGWRAERKASEEFWNDRRHD